LSWRIDILGLGLVYYLGMVFGHFWMMLRTVWAYHLETGLQVIVRDDEVKRTIGFATDCPADDVRYREWFAWIGDVSLTGKDAGEGIPGLDTKWVLEHLGKSLGRAQIAAALSGKPV